MLIGNIPSGPRFPLTTKKTNHKVMATAAGALHEVTAITDVHGLIFVCGKETSKQTENTQLEAPKGAEGTDISLGW